MFRFLNKCAQIEENTALIYHEFANNKKCDPDLAAIWLRMARDEENHAQQLKLAIRLLRDDIADLVKDGGVNPDEMNGLAKSVLGKARNENYELLDMLNDAVVLEDSFRNIHATCALEFKDPSLLATFKRLAQADEVHVEGLNTYLAHYKDDLCSSSIQE